MSQPRLMSMRDLASRLTLPGNRVDSKLTRRLRTIAKRGAATKPGGRWYVTDVELWEHMPSIARAISQGPANQQCRVGEDGGS